MIFYGRNVTIEALRSNCKVNRVFIQNSSSSDNKVEEIVHLTQENDIPLEKVNRKQISKMVENEEHQGVAVDLEFEYGKLNEFLKQAEIASDEEQTSKSFIYISDAEYEHNIGAIVRSAEVSGMDGVIIPKSISMGGTIAKTSAGGIFHIPIFRESIFNAITLMKKNNFFVYGIERDGRKYFETDLTENVLFIIGAEDKSLSDTVRKDCNEILEIPQSGNVNSLNMSVAASLIMFERIRQLETLN